MDCSPPGSSVHQIFQARTLEGVAISFSRGSSISYLKSIMKCFWKFLPSVYTFLPILNRRTQIGYMFQGMKYFKKITFSWKPWLTLMITNANLVPDFRKVNGRHFCSFWKTINYQPRLVFTPVFQKKFHIQMFLML